MWRHKVQYTCTNILMELATFIFRVEAMLVTIYQTTICHIPDKTYTVFT